MRIEVSCKDGYKRIFQKRKMRVGDSFSCTHCGQFFSNSMYLGDHTCELSDLDKKQKGRDRYGRFYNFTGHEEKGHCFWCGKPTKTRYCCKQHSYLYLVHFHWLEASENVYKRIYDPVRKCCVCEKCGIVFSGDNTIDIHHIIPLNGADRSWSFKNRPENLLGLCKDCHKETHRVLFKAIEKERTKRLIMKKELLGIQPELF